MLPNEAKDVPATSQAAFLNNATAIASMVKVVYQALLNHEDDAETIALRINADKYDVRRALSTLKKQGKAVQATDAQQRPATRINAKGNLVQIWRATVEGDVVTIGRTKPEILVSYSPSGVHNESALGIYLDGKLTTKITAAAGQNYEEVMKVLPVVLSDLGFNVETRTTN